MSGTSSISCPRCDYDQRGEVDRWSEACPLEGTCAECGLTFPWSEVLNGHLHEPRWCIEHAPRSRIGMAAAATLARALWPWLFWSKLRLAHRIRWRRIGVFWLLLLFVPALLYVGSQTYLALAARSVVNQAVAGAPAQAQASLAALQQHLQVLTDHVSGVNRDSQVGAEFDQILTTPEERTKHIASLQAHVAQLQAQSQTAPTIARGWVHSVFEAVCMPLSRTSGNAIVHSSYTQPYPAPCDLWRVLGAGRGGSFYAGLIMPMTFFGLTLLVLAALPLSMILMPFSRRRAKVRWAHIFRVAAYSMVIPVVVLVGMVGLLLADSTMVVGINWSSYMMPLAVGGPLILGVFWWWAAISRYLRIPHGLLTAFMLTIMCALLVPFAVGIGGWVTREIYRWLI